MQDLPAKGEIFLYFSKNLLRTPSQFLYNPEEEGKMRSIFLECLPMKWQVERSDACRYLKRAGERYKKGEGGENSVAGIKDVAKKAHVGVGTVSRMLNDSGYVAVETRKKIEIAMKELDYTPNELARNLYRY